MQNHSQISEYHKYVSLAFLLVLLVLLAALTACSGSNSDADASDTTTPDTNTPVVSAQPEFDPFAFASGALTETVISVSCTLSNGEASTCYQITIAGTPATHEVGSFCPQDISASADEVGIWFDGNGEVYDLDGDFIQNLSIIYNDSN